MRTIQGLYFDTVNTITADCDEEILRSCMQLCKEFEKKLSKTIKGSDVWNLNASEGRPVQVSEDTCNIIKCALQFYQYTNKAFHIGIEPLVNLWNVKNAKEPPLDDEIKKAIQKVGELEIVVADNEITVPKGMQIDLGGIAKGYITDKVADFLRDKKINSGLLNFGGNIVAINTKPDKTPWKVGIQRPFATTGQDYFAITWLNNNTIVTSGIYERYFVSDGRLYHHIIDPKTGYPSSKGIILASVIGKESMVADALATSVLLLGWEEGKALCEKFGYEVLAVFESGEIFKSDGFQIQLVK